MSFYFFVHKLPGKSPGLYFYSMDLFTYKASLLKAIPPADISVYLLSLWHDARGDWEKAHETIQDVTTKNASWIHAYLHRKEGDTFNADYWYSKAGKTRPSTSLEQEWESISEVMIDEQATGVV